MATPRLRRGEQVERNRELLLAAAREVFLERGFHAATLEAIAEAAGFSKGVVYSQFESKADLFLALLERRIEERAEQNERTAARAGGAAGVSELIALCERIGTTDLEWELLVIEFRIHAARDPDLKERYARAHARTIERLAALLRRHLEGTGGEPGSTPEAMALFILAFGAGAALERAGARVPLPSGDVSRMLARALGVTPGATGAAAESTARRSGAAPRRRAEARGTRRMR